MCILYIIEHIYTVMYVIETPTKPYLVLIIEYM